VFAAKARVFHHPGLHLLHRAIYLVIGPAVVDEEDRSDQRDFVIPARSLAGIDNRGCPAFAVGGVQVLRAIAL
jgi:hypothetical protein